MLKPFAAVCVFALGSSFVPLRQLPPQASQSARVAALRHVLDQGFQLPDGLKIVATEVDLFRLHQSPSDAGQTDEARILEARALAALVGDSGRIGSAGDLLRCVSFRCVPSGNHVVITVSTPSDAGIVLVTILAPSDRPSQYDGRQTVATVRVARHGDGWVATGYSSAPSTGAVTLRKE